VWVRTHAISRTVGSFRLVWLICWWTLKDGGRLRPSGSRLSSLSVDRGRRVSIVMWEVRKTHATSRARRWLLTCEWGVWLGSIRTKPGPYSAGSGSLWEADGVVDLEYPIQTIST